jgi:tetratricopeptide (TPR) repeat protein
MIGITGVTGSKEKGLDMLRQCAAQGVVNVVECRTSLSLFLRHDGRYVEALAVQHGLAQEYPRDFLFRLEEANLSKDKGDGPSAIAVYSHVLEDARRPGFFVEARLQLAYFGLAETERGQNLIADAATHYVAAANQPTSSDWIKKRAWLNAGQMYDLLHQREKAIEFYTRAAGPGTDQSQAEAARKYLKSPYTGK